MASKKIIKERAIKREIGNSAAVTVTCALGSVFLGVTTGSFGYAIQTPEIANAVISVGTPLTILTVLGAFYFAGRSNAMTMPGYVPSEKSLKIAERQSIITPVSERLKLRKALT